MDKLKRMDIVRIMRLNSKKSINKTIEDIQREPTLVGKCILARRDLAPQSTAMETIVRRDMNILKAVDNISGDGSKNGKNYEIKLSLHARDSRFNFVQIRPDHNIDYYIFIGYNLEFGDEGQACMLVIPSDAIYRLIVKYGGYAHGTIDKLGALTLENMKGRNCEYALRCCPNSKTKKGKNAELWAEMLKYEVTYDAKNI